MTDKPLHGIKLLIVNSPDDASRKLFADLARALGAEVHEVELQPGVDGPPQLDALALIGPPPKLKCAGCGVEHEVIRDGRLVQVTPSADPGVGLCGRCLGRG